MNKTQYDWCVVYRTGGTENFQWHRSLAMAKDEANQSKLDMERSGRSAMVFRYSQSVSIGLPSTYAGTDWETRDAKRREMEAK